MVELHPDLMDLRGALAASNADLIVGGWAVSFHSEPRYTKDLDLLIGDDDANLVRVVNAIETFGAPRVILDKARTLQPDEFLFFGVPPARVDVLRSIPGVGFRNAYDRRIVASWSPPDCSRPVSPCRSSDATTCSRPRRRPVASATYATCVHSREAGRAELRVVG